MAPLLSLSKRAKASRHASISSLERDILTQKPSSRLRSCVSGRGSGDKTAEKFGVKLTEHGSARLQRRLGVSRDRGKAANETRAESDRETKLNKLTGRTYESRHSRLDSRQHDRGRGAVSAAPQRLQHVQGLVEVQDLERDAGLPRPLDRPVADLLAGGPDGRERRRDGLGLAGCGRAAAPCPRWRARSVRPSHRPRAARRPPAAARAAGVAPAWQCVAGALLSVLPWH